MKSFKQFIESRGPEHRYHKGVEDKAVAREAHFKRRVGKKGFVPAPGDEDIDKKKMPKSQYTKEYHRQHTKK